VELLILCKLGKETRRECRGGNAASRGFAARVRPSLIATLATLGKERDCSQSTHTPTPRVLTPRVDRDVSPTFVKQELCKLKLSKATGLDEIPARVLKDAAPEIAKPIAYLINLTIFTGIIPQEWKEAKVTPIFKSGEKDDVN